MEAAEQFTIGASVSCTDGPCGTLTRVVVDPVARAVTHLIVTPHERHVLPLLVPLDLVDTATDEIRLRATRAEFERLNPAEERRFIEGTTSYAAYGPEQAVFWPHYGYRGARGDVVVSDTIPVGEVEVGRGDPVHAADGDIGHVQGLVVDPDSHHVTHILLQEGHAWGRKEVAIPISAVTKVDYGIRVSLTKQQVEDLPPADLERPAQ